MSEDWKAGLHRAVIDTIVAQGGVLLPVRDADNWQFRGTYRTEYGWNDYDETVKAKQLYASEGIDYEKSSYVDSNWTEFTGTFSDDIQEYGLDATIVSTGGIKHQWRYDGTLGALLRGILGRDGID